VGLGFIGGFSNVAQPPRSYSTSFPLTENPMSEGGIWTNGSTFSQGAATKGNVQTAGKAYGNMVSFDGTNYDDSLACLSGFGPNHEVTCTLVNLGGFAGYSLEAEILLRSTITSSVVHQYEVDCVWGGQGIALVRWDMDSTSPNSFTQLRGLVTNETPFANGDQVYASIVGTLITVKYKSGAGAFSTVFTYDTASDPVKYSTGNPGIGFWNETGDASLRPNFAWGSFAANTL